MDLRAVVDDHVRRVADGVPGRVVKSKTRLRQVANDCT
jgi:hypothetical protein